MPSAVPSGASRTSAPNSARLCERLRSSNERAVIAAKLAITLKCFKATRDALRDESSTLRRNADAMTTCVTVVKMHFSLETTATSMLALNGKQLVQVCKEYKRNQFEYGRDLM